MRIFLIKYYTLILNVIYLAIFWIFGLVPAMIFFTSVALFMFGVWFIANSTHKRYRTLKTIYWLQVRSHEVAHLVESKFSSLISYPMMIWIAFEAEEQFLNNNSKDFVKIVLAKITEIADNIINPPRPIPKPACRYIGIEFTGLDEEEYDFIDRTLEKGGFRGFSAN